MLSWACTGHKVQGLSFDKAVIRFDLFFNRLYLTGEYNADCRMLADN